MFRLTSGLALLAAASLSGVAVAQHLAPQQFPFKSGPVTITACSVAKNGNILATNSLDVKYYQNEQTSNLKSVTFRVTYAHKTVTFTNNGTFSYRAPIEVHSDLLDGSPWSGPHPQVCRVLTATFEDGKIVNPPYLREDVAPGMTPQSEESAGPAMPEGAPEASPAAETTPAPVTTPQL